MIFSLKCGNNKEHQESALFACSTVEGESERD